MTVDVPAAQPDPALQSLEKQSTNNNLGSLQKAVSSDTDLLARLFGSSAAAAGSAMKAPILGL